MAQKPDENRTGRGIEGIAHHFLSGMSSRQAGPQRQGPQANLPSSSEPPISITETSSLTQMIVFSDHLEQSSKKVQHFVQQMVVEEGPMALLDLTDAATIQLREFKAGKVSECELELLDESINTAWQELFGSNAGHPSLPGKTGEEFFRQIDKLPEKVETVVLNLSRRLDEEAERLLRGANQVVLLCGCQQEQLLKTYRLIKRLITKIKGTKLSLFFFGQKNEKDAVGVYEKLAETCREFLDYPVEWAGCEQPIDACELELAVADRNETTTELLYKLFGQMEIERCETVEAPSEETVTRKSDGVREPLAVDVLPTDDAALTKVLVQQVGRWMNGEAIEALELPLPEGLDEQAVILTDGAGKFYVLLAGLGATEEKLSQAMKVRGWVRKNLQLIQGYFREKIIGEEGEIGMILVGNSPVDRLVEVQEQLNFTCRVKQVYLLEAKAFKGILVV